MDMNRKIERAKEALNMITRADDAPIDDMNAALLEVAEHLKAETVAAVERRAAAEQNPTANA